MNDAVFRLDEIDVHRTAAPEPVILHHCLCATIIAINPSFRVLEFWRHRLGFDALSQSQERAFHVEHASTTDWTFI